MSADPRRRRRRATLAPPPGSPPAPSLPPARPRRPLPPLPARTWCSAPAGPPPPAVGARAGRAAGAGLAATGSPPPGSRGRLRAVRTGARLLDPGFAASKPRSVCSFRKASRRLLFRRWGRGAGAGAVTARREGPLLRGRRCLGLPQTSRAEVAPRALRAPQKPAWRDPRTRAWRPRGPHEDPGSHRAPR
ncbi:atherin-like [Lontra canadensis]|uniref:atherin-like n=1 Tax=Lontra canadensis TaxID=76717 RepID=UPI0013F2EF9D|nr:atherin-like [Lontra canadensis]